MFTLALERSFSKEITWSKTIERQDVPVGDGGFYLSNQNPHVLSNHVLSDYMLQCLALYQLSFEDHDFDSVNQLLNACKRLQSINNKYNKNDFIRHTISPLIAITIALDQDSLKTWGQLFAILTPASIGEELFIKLILNSIELMLLQGRTKEDSCLRFFINQLMPYCQSEHEIIKNDTYTQLIIGKITDNDINITMKIKKGDTNNPVKMEDKQAFNDKIKDFFEQYPPSNLYLITNMMPNEISNLKLLQFGSYVNRLIDSIFPFSIKKEEETNKVIAEYICQYLTEETIKTEIDSILQYINSSSNDYSKKELEKYIYSIWFQIALHKMEKNNKLDIMCDYFICILMTAIDTGGSKLFNDTQSIIWGKLIENNKNSVLINKILEKLLESSYTYPISYFINKNLAEFITIAALALHRQVEIRDLIKEIIETILSYQGKMAIMMYHDFLTYNPVIDSIDKLLRNEHEQKMLLYFTNKNALEEFEKKYNYLLTKTPPLYQIDFKRFLTKIGNKINGLVVIFDKKTIDILMLLLGTSLVDINKFFEIDISIIEEKLCLKNLAFLNYKTGNNVIEIFQLVQILNNINSDPETIKYVNTLLESIKTKQVSHSTFIETLSIYVANFFLKEIKINMTAQEFTQSNIYSLPELSKLLSGYYTHSQDGHMSVLPPILKCYLQPSTYPLDEFLWGKNQSDKDNVGRSISDNNLQTQAIFEKYGIDKNLVSKYPDQVKFEVAAPEKIDLNQSVITVWTGINQLSENLNLLLGNEEFRNFFSKTGKLKSSDTLKRKMNAYINTINTKIKNSGDLTVSNEKMAKYFLSQKSMPLLIQLKPLLEKSEGDLSELSQSHLPNPFLTSLTSVLEFNNHAQCYILALEQAHAIASKVDEKDTLQRHRKFHIEIWDKSNPKTPFLGNYLSCCLATDGAQFPAIWQRIVDCAMAMSIVVDDETNEPVSGMWLYYATDEETDQPYLVANFIEMRVNIAQHQAILRDVILSQLIQFTNQYAHDVLVTKNNHSVDHNRELYFLMAQLGYGTLPDLVFFDSKEYVMKKMGPMSLDDEIGDYYLKSSGHLNLFYQYSSDKLKERFKEENKYIISVPAIDISDEKNPRDKNNNPAQHPDQSHRIFQRQRQSTSLASGIPPSALSVQKNRK